MDLDSLTLNTVTTVPSSLQDALDELKLISQAVEKQPKLDQLPLLIRRTNFLKSHLEDGILAIEADIHTLSIQPTDGPATPSTPVA